MPSSDLCKRRKRCKCCCVRKPTFCERVDECVVQDFLSRVFWALPQATPFEAAAGVLRPLSIPTLETREANDFEQIQTGPDAVNTLMFTGPRTKSFQVSLAGTILNAANAQAVDLQIVLFRGRNGALPTEQIGIVRAETLIAGGGQGNLGTVGGLTLDPGDTLLWYFSNSTPLVAGSMIANYATTISYW